MDRNRHCDARGRLSWRPLSIIGNVFSIGAPSSRFSIRATLKSPQKNFDPIRHVLIALQREFRKNVSPHALHLVYKSVFYFNGMDPATLSISDLIS
jgi:hypothetical protein